MPAEVPDGCKRYLLSTYERYPTLHLHDGVERDGDMPGETRADDRTVILPDALFTMWKKACEQLAVVEDTVKTIAQTQARFDNPAEFQRMITEHFAGGETPMAAEMEPE